MRVVQAGVGRQTLRTCGVIVLIMVDRVLAVSWPTVIQRARFVESHEKMLLSQRYEGSTYPIEMLTGTTASWLMPRNTPS